MRIIYPSRFQHGASTLNANWGQWAVLVGLLMAQLAGFEAAAATFTVTTTAPGGAGSLDQAIRDANGSPGPDTIAFQIPGPAPHIIVPTNGLPPLLDPVIIDATTQPDFAGKPTVQLMGTLAGPNSGLRLASGSTGSTIRGLAIILFSGDGVHIENSHSNILQGNFLGTDTTGTNADGNGNTGVWIVNSSGNLVGGTNAAQRNIISGRNTYGVYLQGNASGNVVAGNFIGTSAKGTSALSNLSSGLVIYGASGNQIGGLAPGMQNVVSANGGYGIYITAAAASNAVLGNLIGTDAGGTAALGNLAAGVRIDGASGNSVGGTNVGARNVIAANAEAGVTLISASTNVVQGNFIGTDVSGKLALSNRFSGVTISGGSENLIGGVNGGRNVISGNHLEGVFLTADSHGNRIENNFIGVDVTGANALGNGAGGISLNGASSNVIGGVTIGTGNVISGNGNHGILMVSSTATGNQVLGNLIGTDATGQTALGNGLDGVHIESPGNIVGAPSPSGRNVISGNGQDGVHFVSANASNNVVQGNFVGTDPTGTGPLPNLRAGVGVSDAPANTIGGTTAPSGNVISGNYLWGLYVIGSGASRNQVQGNRIGTDVTGTLALGNWDGIRVDQTGTNVIGGVVAGSGNLISGNSDEGLLLSDAWSTLIQGNLIGTKIDGIGDLGNYLHGVDIQGTSTNNTVGGLVRSAANRIAYSKTHNGNGYVGVRVRDSATGNAILGNAIFSNDGLGIDLSPYGVNANLNCREVGVGPNMLQNYPVLSQAYSGPFIAVRGSLISAPGQTYRLQFFASRVCDPLGYGEGEIYLGDTAVVTHTDCSVNFAAALLGSVPPGYVLTATATDPAGNTSEFSACVPVAPMPTLTVKPSGGQALAISWTSTAAGFALMETDGLTQPARWAPVTNNPVITNGQFVVTRPATSGTRYYALRFEVPSPPLPVLSITPRGGQQVALSWTNTATRFALKETDNLAPPVQWQPVTEPPDIVNGQFVVTRPATNAHRFYVLGFE